MSRLYVFWAPSAWCRHGIVGISDAHLFVALQSQFRTPVLRKPAPLHRGNKSWIHIGTCSLNAVLARFEKVRAITGTARLLVHGYLRDVPCNLCFQLGLNTLICCVASKCSISSICASPTPFWRSQLVNQRGHNRYRSCTLQLLSCTT